MQLAVLIVACVYPVKQRNFVEIGHRNSGSSGHNHTVSCDRQRSIHPHAGHHPRNPSTPGLLQRELNDIDQANQFSFAESACNETCQRSMQVSVLVR